MTQAVSATNKPLQLDGTPGHGQGSGSGSGAGIWLAGTASTVVGGGDRDSHAAPVGRSYHISAEASRPTSLLTNDLFLSLNPSESGDVDLDLSFEFVSQLETNKYQVNRPVQPNATTNVITSSTEQTSPRGGMSTAKWSSRTRKQPPSALKLPNKNQLAVTTSHFSPISPLYHKVDGEAPLLVIPLGSTRRAIDSNIQSEHIQTLGRADLIQQQRLAAQAQNKEQQQRLSPEKRSPNKQSTSILLRKRTILGENKNYNNVQLVPSVEHGDVFDDATYYQNRDINKTANQVSNWAGIKSSSFAKTPEYSHKKGQQQPKSMESLSTYDSALSAASSGFEMPTIAMNRAMPSDNFLGLDLTGAIPKSNEAAPALFNNTTIASPDSAFSPIFSEADSTRSQSDGIDTPGTAFSTLFDDRMSSSGDSKSEIPIQMKRGRSAPLPNTTPLVHDVIKEEESNHLQKAQSASADSFLVDLSLMPDDIEDLRERHGPILSISDFGSSPIKGGRTMIVSTASSPTNEVEFLFRKPSQINPIEENKSTSGARVGPWTQSPLLLNNFPDGEFGMSLGLGIDMGGKMADHMQLDMSELSVERAILPMLDENTLGLDLGTEMMQDPHFAPSKMEISLAPSKVKEQITTSASIVSSVEGFAFNITPAVKDSLRNIELPLVKEAESQSRSRWSSKLWSLGPLASLRSPSRAAANSNRAPAMKQLTLRGNTEQDGYNSVPGSAALPMYATFTPLQAPSSRVRSSRHVSRSSRLRYLPDENGHTQVDMTSPQLDRASKSAQIDAVSRFQTAGMTPRVEYMNSTRTRRHSWGYASSSGHTGVLSWSASNHLNVPDARESHLFNNMHNSTLSAIGPTEAESLSYRPMDTVVEDGIRRRVNHRATNSVPSTPIVLPASWASPELHEEYHGYNEYEQGVNFDADEMHARQGRSRRTGAIASTIDIYGPASAVGPYLLGLTGTRNRSKMVKMTGQYPANHYATRRHTQVQLFSNDGDQIEGLIAISGRALEISPSRSLFFAGFLAMPWLWFIGGWGLENDGSIYLGREAVVLDAQQSDFKEREADETMATYVTGRHTHFLHRDSMLSARGDGRYAMGTPESIIDMEQEYQDSQRQGKAQSFIEQSAQINGDDYLQRRNARKAQSLLEGEERNSRGPLSRQELREMANSISIPVDMSEEEASRLHSIDINSNRIMEIREAFALPISGWDDYDDYQNKFKENKKVTFFQQVLGANTQMLRRITSSPATFGSTNASFSLANIEERRKAIDRLQNHSSPSHQPALIRAFTDWTRLETFVLFNRIMATLVSIAVFGAAGAAIFFVVSDW